MSLSRVEVKLKTLLKIKSQYEILYELKAAVAVAANYIIFY